MVNDNKYKLIISYATSKIGIKIGGTNYIKVPKDVILLFNNKNKIIKYEIYKSKLNDEIKIIIKMI